MKKFLVLAALAAFATMSGSAAAHDFAYPDIVTFDSFDSFGPLNHEDVPNCTLEESKGFFSVTVLNNTNIAWSSFHFQLIPLASQVVFTVTESMVPTSSQTLDATPWAYTDTTFDFFFSGDKVLNGQTASFKVWTDNTANGNPFAVLFYPVPEPASLSVLALGGLLALRRRRA